MRFLLLLALILPAHAKILELRFKEIQHPIQVFLPENFDPAKKHPAIFHYHGTNGTPDTQLIRQHTDDQGWIVVGMAYAQAGQLQLTPQNFARELGLYHAVRKHLLTNYSLDPQKVYLSGFSKGGWITDLLLQHERTVTGGAILGAGHLHKAPQPLTRYATKKPVFIGIGRLDGNYPFALKAITHHRSLGGTTDLEVWPTLAHAFPKDGSTALRQWLNIQRQGPDSLRDEARQQMLNALENARSLDPIDRWARLRELRTQPYAKLLPPDLAENIASQISSLEKSPEIKAEADTLKQHRRILAKEISGTSLQSLQQVNVTYLDLSDRFSSTRQSKLLLHDHDRTSTLLKHFQEQTTEQTPKKESTIVVPDNPSRRTNFPVNPLVR
ncbi:MAG: hypothetical protein ACSHYF_05720 [Verrucomicrobiaceae bacterium]